MIIAEKNTSTQKADLPGKGLALVDYTEIQNCDNFYWKFTIWFESNVTCEHVNAWAENGVLVARARPWPDKLAESELAAGLFKIVNSDYVIRGAMGSNRISVECLTSDKAMAKELLRKAGLFIK